jgi:hypothetical protein
VEHPIYVTGRCLEINSIFDTNGRLLIAISDSPKLAHSLIETVTHFATAHSQFFPDSGGEASKK